MNARGAERIAGLYGMIDQPRPDAAAAARAAAMLLDAGVGVVQLRVKHAEAGALLTAARALRAFLDGRALFIVNDRLDVALAAGADGVHLGQDDLPLAAARPLVPPGFVIGISTHDEQQARAAAAAGADYLGFGPIFATTTKENPDPVVGTERLSAVCREVRIPVVAIGGITLDNIDQVARSGARAAAVIAAVFGAADPATAARTIVDAFAARR